MSKMKNLRLLAVILAVFTLQTALIDMPLKDHLQVQLGIATMPFLIMLGMSAHNSQTKDKINTFLTIMVVFELIIGGIWLVGQVV